MSYALHSTRAIPVEHVTIRSTKPFEDVRAKLATLAFDDGIFTLLRYGESERAIRELEACPPLTIFGQRDHGALLAVAGLTRRSIQFDIGNPLTASKMTAIDCRRGSMHPFASFWARMKMAMSRLNMIGRHPCSVSLAANM